LELARRVIHPSIVEEHTDEELIQQISAAVRGDLHTLQVVPENISIKRAGSGGDSGMSSLSVRQAQGSPAVASEYWPLRTLSIGTFSNVSGVQPADDDVIVARWLLTAETISTSSSGCQNPPANPSSGERESHAQLQQQPLQNEDQSEETNDERKQPAQKKPRID
jgi:hypothetical protein